MSTLSPSVAKPPSVSLCCTSDAWEYAPQARMPWLRLVIGMFIAAQTMSLGIAISVTKPQDAATLFLLQAGMLAATALVLVLLGIPLAIDSVRQLARGRMTIELFFMLGISAALAISIRSMVLSHGIVYFDVVCVLVIVYSIGRTINAHSRGRALSASRALTRQISTARRIVAGEDQFVPVESIGIGDRVRVLAGEWIPVDGVIVQGASLVRQTPFSGEWTSVSRSAGDSVLAGTTAEDGTLLIQTTSIGTDRRVDQLAGLIESARRSPTSLQRQADRLIRWFLPLILIACVLTLGYWALRSGWEDGLFNALAVLLIACPCAAGLATPLALWSALGHLAQRGLIIRSGDAIERLAAVDTVVFDKTGTLGDHELTLKSIATQDDPQRRAQTLGILRAVERQSNHPVAKVLSAIDLPDESVQVHVSAVRVLPGRGVEADVRLAGADSIEHLVQITRDLSARDPGALHLTMTIDRQWAASIALIEHLRDSADTAVESIRQMNLDVRIMTGDSAAGASRTAHLGDITAAMTPQDKHAAVLALQESGHRVLFIGDGINDAAAMASSHVSIALADGADIVTDVSSATLFGGDLLLIPYAVALSRRAVTTVRWNLLWAILYNFVGVLVAAAGYLHPVVAAVLMSASSLLVGWRSFRVVPHVSDDEEPLTPAQSVQRAVQLAPRCPVVTPAAEVLAEPSALHRRLYIGSHWIGLLSQAVILCILASLGWIGWGITIAAFAVLAILIGYYARRLPPYLDMILAMLSIGGLGMTAGWWADTALSPMPDHVMQHSSMVMKHDTAHDDDVQGISMHEGVAHGSDIHDDGMHGNSMHDAGAHDSSIHNVGAPRNNTYDIGAHDSMHTMAHSPGDSVLANPHDAHSSSTHWMYWGMIGLGVPAMYLLRWRFVPFTLKRWCCVGPIVVGIPGMVFGMWAGSVLTMQITDLAPWAHMVVHYVMMTLGMLAGMMLPHLGELLLPPSVNE